MAEWFLELYKWPERDTEKIKRTKTTKHATLPQLCNHKYNKIWSVIPDSRHCSSGRKIHGYRTSQTNTKPNKGLV